MKKFILLILNTIISIVCIAQNLPEKSSRTMFYSSFQPVVITLTDGRVINQKQANIFLKNSSLIYKRGLQNMEANIEQVKSVKFPSDYYLRVDTVLARVIDTLKQSKLLCITMIDMDAYCTQLLNNQQITNLELGNHVNISSMNLISEDNAEYPLINHFLYEINGKIVKVHERAIQKILPKDKRRIFKTIIQSSTFNWNDPKSLMILLKAVI